MAFTQISIHALRGEGDSKCDGRTHRICGKVPKGPGDTLALCIGQKGRFGGFSKRVREKAPFYGCGQVRSSR